MAKSLKNTAITAFLWSGMEGFLRPLIMFIYGIIMARILLPADFGQFAMVSFILGLSTVLFDSGFGTALVQKRDTTNQDFSTVFLFNVIIGAVLVILIYVCSPYISSFFNEPILTKVTRVYSINILIRSITSTQSSLIVKKLEYKKLTSINTTAIIISSIAGIVLAILDYGVWALVGQTLIYNTMYSVLIWTSSSWQPTKDFDFSALRALFKYGSRIFLAALIETTYKHIYNVIIGRKFFSMQLGYYDRSSRVQQLPVENFEIVLHRVLFPVFSAIQDDKVELVKAYRKTISIIAFINFPLITIISLSSESIVLLLYGEKWLTAAPMLQVLIFTGLFYPLISLNTALIKATGRSGTYLKLSILSKSILTLSIILLIGWGIQGLIWGQVISSIISFMVYSWVNARFLSYQVKDQFKAIFPYLLLSSVIFVLLYLITDFIPSNNALKLLLQIGSGIGLYWLVSHFLRFSAYIEVLKIITETLRKNFKR